VITDTKGRINAHFGNLHGHGRDVPNAATTPPITVNSLWIRKQVPVEVIVTRVTFREVSYIAVDKSFSGTLPLWLFLQDFQPVTERKKKRCSEYHEGRIHCPRAMTVLRPTRKLMP
jgi:hypothetical protein